MSKSIGDFFSPSYMIPNFLKKILKTLKPGQTIVPNLSGKLGKNAQLRIDAGEKIGDIQNVVLQVNSNATSIGLKDWVKR